MKKNLLFLPLVLAGLAVSSCSKYDDSAFAGRISQVEERVAKLEEQAIVLNRDIVAIRTLLTALESKDYVSKVEPITEGSRSGYQISFTKASPITIFPGISGANGQNGLDGVSPVVGIRQEAGIYYWTSNGVWLTDGQGQRIKAQGPSGQSGVTPLLKVENEYWHVSYDTGQTWQSLNIRARGEQGAAGANAFRAVKVEDTQVVFTLADGTQSLTLPLYQEMSLRFTNTEDYIVFPNQTYEIPYTTTGVTSDTQIKIIERQGVQTQLVRNDDNGGVIRVTMPRSVGDTEVLVFLVDGRGYAKMYSLILYRGMLTTKSDNYLTDRSGDTLEVPIQANSEYTVEIPSEATSWISYEKLRALTIRDEKLRFTIQANPLAPLRSAVVKLRSKGRTVKTITIAQRGGGRSYAIMPGRSLEEQLGGNLPYELKLTSGTLSRVDFMFLRENSDRIKILDLSELPMTSLPVSAFSGSKFEEVKLPNGLTAIPDRCFDRSTIRRISIPQGVTRIGYEAFIYCGSLTGPLVIPQGVTNIGRGAFSFCRGLTGPLVIPHGVMSIGDFAFGDCSGFTGPLVIPQSVTSIGISAFNGCSGLTGPLVIPQGVTSIGVGAFWKCSGFTGPLVLPRGVTSIGEQAFSGCSGFTGSLVIPQGVTSIGEQAFSDCSGFTGSLVIPQGVTSIGEQAFSGCTGLDGDLLIGGNPVIGELAFAQKTRERLNFRAVYSKGKTPKLISHSAFGAGADSDSKPPILHIPTGTRTQYEQKAWASQFERVAETDTWPRVNQ